MASGPEVHPASHSVIPATSAPPNAANWITQNVAGQPGPQNGFSAVHACVIPSGPHRGEVLVWDGNLTLVGTRAYQPCAIVNPYYPSPNPFVPGAGIGSKFHNWLLEVPLDPSGQPMGELFCAGQRWLSDGRLFVAGGTKRYPIQLGGADRWEGAKFVWQWDPTPTAGNPFGTWFRMVDMEVERWYPTVSTDGTTAERTMVFGGTHWNGTAQAEVNTYESFRSVFGAYPPMAAFEQKTVPPIPPPTARQYPGPSILTPVGTYGFFEYPRIHALGVFDPIAGGSARRMLQSGYAGQAVHWGHDPNNNPNYQLNVGQEITNSAILHVTNILYPAAVGALPSLVLRIGGLRVVPGGGVTSRVESATVNEVAPATSTWSSGTPNDIPDMVFARSVANVVILPNRELFAVGGIDEYGAMNYVPEILRVGQGWKEMAPHSSPRGYHSCPVLLPDGRVFVCGGEARSSDYEIYSPEYLQVPANQRPQNLVLVNEFTLAPISQTALSGVAYGQTVVAGLNTRLPTGVTIEEAVLLAPAALTHHDDGGQRCIPLLVQDDSSFPHGSARVTMPASAQYAPPGWYMLFVLTNAGIPSNAVWINLR